MLIAIMDNDGCSGLFQAMDMKKTNLMQNAS